MRPPPTFRTLPAHVCARWLFVAAAGFYVASGAGVIRPVDGVVMFTSTEAFLHGRLDVDPIRWREFGVLPKLDRTTGQVRLYSKFGIALSLAGIPLDALGALAFKGANEADKQLVTNAARGRSLFYKVEGENYPEAFRALFVSGTNSFVVAATLALLFLLLVELEFNVGIALAAAVLVGIGTPLWEAATNQFSEPLGALGVVGMALFARRAAWARAGAFLSVAILAKPALAVLAIAAMTLVMLHPLRPGERSRLRRAWRFAAGALPLVSIGLGYNIARFGTPFETGYGSELSHWTTPFWEGFLGLLASPGRGLLIYAPLWLLAIPAAADLRRRCRPEAMFAIAALVSLLLLYSTWYMWEGGWCWGPRYLVPVVPLLGLPCAAVLDRARSSRALAVAVGVVFLSAVAVALSGLLVDAYDFDGAVSDNWSAFAPQHRADGFDDFSEFYRWSWGVAPIVRYWTFSPRRGWLVFSAMRHPGVIGLWFGFAAAVCLLATARLAMIQSAATHSQ